MSSGSACGGVLVPSYVTVVGDLVVTTGGGWVSHRASLDLVAKGNILPCWQ
jgi:hypothetical protein